MSLRPSLSLLRPRLAPFPRSLSLPAPLASSLPPASPLPRAVRVPRLQTSSEAPLPQVRRRRRRLPPRTLPLLILPSRTTITPLQGQLTPPLAPLRRVSLQRLLPLRLQPRLPGALQLLGPQLPSPVVASQAAQPRRPSALRRRFLILRSCPGLPQSNLPKVSSRPLQSHGSLPTTTQPPRETMVLSSRGSSLSGSVVLDRFFAIPDASSPSCSAAAPTPLVHSDSHGQRYVSPSHFNIFQAVLTSASSLRSSPLFRSPSLTRSLRIRRTPSPLSRCPPPPSRPAPSRLRSPLTAT